jgi:hypothetical protein
LAVGTKWVFGDESAHMSYAYEAIDTGRAEDPVSRVIVPFSFGEES